MFTTGLVSVSFRPLSPAEVIAAAKSAGLGRIEWGGDIHAPHGDREQAKAVAALQKKEGVCCCSYGSYFRLGDPPELLNGCFESAELLGTDVVRIWAGRKSWSALSEDERKRLAGQAALAARRAENAGMILCTECHPNTATDCAEGTLALIGAADSPHFRTYWQPNQHLTTGENLTFLTAVLPHVRHIHVFNWAVSDGVCRRFPLADGAALWRQYLSVLDGCDPSESHGLLLEFMPDDCPQTLPREADTLRELLRTYQKHS